MARRKGNFDYNYPRVIEYLKRNNIAYEEFAEGQHLKIAGDGAWVELWPSRMTYHILAYTVPPEVDKNEGYRRLSFYFKEKELETLLNQ